MAGATAPATPTPPGGTGSAALAGATGSSGGTTTGTVACSSCCAPQGRYLVDLFGGYMYAGLCPGAIDNSQPFPVYFTFVLSFDSPYTAAQFCVPSSLTLTATAYDYMHARFEITGFCTAISPPSTTTNIAVSTLAAFGILSPSSYVSFTIYLCGCTNPGLAFGADAGSFSLVSCSPPVFSSSCGVYSIPATGFNIRKVGTATVTITF